nr:RsmD family RNA methyltransferase [Belnapia sp. F-4-1]
MATRPTADRVRQALFDMLWHAPWAGRERVEGAAVLDAFAGTGALGLEALSRGAARASFIETDRAALAALRANIAACREEARCTVLAADATRPPRAALPCGLLFLDPPYAEGVMERALAALAAAGWIAPDAIICAEYAAGDAVPPPGFALLAERAHGAAQLLVLRPA